MCFLVPNDPLYSSQWHFSLLGDIETIWSEFVGAGVNVAIYDDGLQYTHADLNDNYDSSLHFSYRGTDYDPLPINAFEDAHGTAVAGVIGGNANGIGGVGVAHGASLTGINLLVQLANVSAATENALWQHGANFDVMSNSWGLLGDFHNDVNLDWANSIVSKTLRGVDHAIDTGRDGKGTVFVISAGNEDANASGSGMNSARQTIAVAATDINGDAQWYSNWGSSVLITAPAAAVTTDLMGFDGYDPFSDYITDFGGTSASAPVVSGVVALMLEANPDLGWRDVQNILAISAAQTGSAYGGPATGEEIADWMSTGTTNWNGGGMSYHLNHGFGMVDAFAAVRMAESWLDLHSGAQTSANEQSVKDTDFVAQQIEDFSVIEHEIEIFQDISIEHILFNFVISHDDLNALDLSLIAPTGEVIPVLLPHPGDQIDSFTGLLDYTVGITTGLGLSSAGTWTVRLEDSDAGDDGYFATAELEFFGSALTTDDVYHFTNDFEALAAVDGARKTVSDTNGGEDWLNFAAFQQNVAINLDNGQLSFDGKVQSVISDNSIENALGGDGDDLFVGNNIANHFLGKRGDDNMRGNHGQDTLEGGQGNDHLRGNGNRDTLIGGEGDDELRGGKSRDRAEGGDNNDEIFGGQGKDNLLGGKGDDLLLGEGNNDTLTGGKGNDSLDGGDGNDVLTGSTGADRFIYNSGYGQDVIEDFADNTDTLVLDDALWTGNLSVTEVIGLSDVVGGNLVFDFGAGDILTLKGIVDASILIDDLTIV